MASLTKPPAKTPGKTAPKKTGGSDITLPPATGSAAATGGGVDLGTGGINWNQDVTTPELDAAVIPILDQSSADPLGLGTLIPQVGRGKAPQTLANRVASVSKMSDTQQQELGGVLAGAGIIAPKSTPYTPAEVQTGLTDALKQASETKAPSLSDYLVSRSGQTATSTAAQTTANQAGLTDDLNKIAGNYLVPVSDAAIASHVASYMGSGLDATQAQAQFTQYVQGLAAGLFPQLAPQINSGVDTKTLLSPYASIAEKTLGVDPNSVDFTQPLWAAALNGPVDPKTNRAALPTLSQFSNTLMSNPNYGYQNTDEAKNTASSLSASILKAFGAIGNDQISLSMSGPTPDLAAT